jgi:hypothetical protein
VPLLLTLSKCQRIKLMNNREGWEFKTHATFWSISMVFRRQEHENYKVKLRKRNIKEKR